MRTERQIYSGQKSIRELYQTVRSRTMTIVKPLEIEDYVVQPEPYVSPPKWHIGHTTWFFEMLMAEYQQGYQVCDEDYLYYFNSYYEKFGSRIERPRRGSRSRPTVQATIAYRGQIDERMNEFLQTLENHPKAAEILALVRLGLEHEMQHQELLVYDIKAIICDLYASDCVAAPSTGERITGRIEIEGGIFEMGYRGPDFSYDNEKPPHLVYLQDYALDLAPVSNEEYLEFIKAGAYQDHQWWFSDGWDAVRQQNWQAPLYWESYGDEWMIRGFDGLHSIAEKANEPVSHVSFFEAAAFAKWAGKRLPTEGEWEKAACYDPVSKTRREFPWGDSAPDTTNSNFFENSIWGPSPIGALPEGRSAYGCYQMAGDLWEWTKSEYAPYPGFTSEFDEYNDKFFFGQKVLKGGSYATPQSHIRLTYRNFFHHDERWMTSGFRCAKTLFR